MYSFLNCLTFTHFFIYIYLNTITPPPFILRVLLWEVRSIPTPWHIFVLACKVEDTFTLQLKPRPVVRWWVGTWSTSLKAILLHTSWLLLYPLLLLYQFNNLVCIHSLIYLPGQQFQRVLQLTRRSPS